MTHQEKDNLVIYGIHPVEEALENPDNVEKVFVKDDISGQGIKELIKKSRGLKIPCFVVDSRKLDRIAGTRNHQGVVAYISPIAYGDIENLIPDIIERGEAPKIMVLDGVTDVRNFGAIARTALFLGFHALVIPARGNARFNEEAVKASAGALLKIPVCRTHVLKQAVFFMKHSGLRIVGASEKAEKPIWDIDLSAPVALVVGSEDEGISNAVLKLCDNLVQIPRTGDLDSLNVSVAAGILAYEVFKQSQ
ncbi:MAG: 23S rRNA (guanosine(2251)-2'-O)-methyltransferase RlmB [Bacteroidia bacterium]|jgi:23S rRNA (guanosine2251-2'-O)-methyltransferase|nr:23S rRNA (guanosine(2251)-2'-O)-methyltransferase RlmB [Bacteroidota bacterium]MCZ2130315.1 23S rRNA (guanosine(2251)-2'-O)-methyltransferase RlmB [Bacteroidia bacterium]